MIRHGFEFDKGTGVDKTVGVIKKEIDVVNGQIRTLESKKDNLVIELQKACQHPKRARYRTSSSEVCGECQKILQSWTPRIGNHI